LAQSTLRPSYSFRQLQSVGAGLNQYTFARKPTELQDRLPSINLQLEARYRFHHETAELAAKVFELSQTLRNQAVSADWSTTRPILEIVCLNCTLDGASAVFSTRNPFDVRIEGLYSQTSRGDRTGFELSTQGTRLWEPETRPLLSVKP
jgi:hypothetical protein